jgi:methylated-DNA-[protein]-cysteine S-methyltransferase
VAADLTVALLRTTIATPLGPFTVVTGPRGIVLTGFGEDLDEDVRRATLEEDRDLAPIRSQVEAYFRGQLLEFEAPVDLTSVGEGFARRALEVVRRIPYGELWTYGDVAAAAGAPRGGRAAGGALARCPVELFVPCHRVVRAGPSLGSYGRHDERRRFLLELEGSLPDGSSRP